MIYLRWTKLKTGMRKTKKKKEKKKVSLFSLFRGQKFYRLVCFLFHKWPKGKTQRSFPRWDRLRDPSEHKKGNRSNNNLQSVQVSQKRRGGGCNPTPPSGCSTISRR